MVNDKLIGISEEVYKLLKEHKTIPREPYGDCLKRILEEWRMLKDKLEGCKVKEFEQLKKDGLSDTEARGTIWPESAETKEFVTPDPDSPTGIKEPESISITEPTTPGPMKAEI